MVRASLVTALLLVAAFAVFSLLSGAAYLELPLPGGLPFGNALTAAGLCAAAWAALTLSPRGSARSMLAACALLAAIAWLPLSIALAGNLALNFAGGRGSAWLLLSLGIVLLVLCALALALVYALLRSSSNR